MSSKKIFLPAIERGPTPCHCWGQGLDNEINVRKVRVTHWHRNYHDGTSDGFRERLSDMFEQNLGPSFAMELV